MNPGPASGFAYDPSVTANGPIPLAVMACFPSAQMETSQRNSCSNRKAASPLPRTAAVNITSPVISPTSRAPGPAGHPARCAHFHPRQNPLPYIKQWKLGRRARTPWHVLLSVSLRRRKARSLTRQFDLHQLTPVPASLNPYVLNTSSAINHGRLQEHPVEPYPHRRETSVNRSCNMKGHPGTSPWTVTNQHVPT